MNRFYARLALIIVNVLLFSTSLFAGSLDDYYLQQFGEAKSDQLQKAVLSVTADVQETAKCGMPIKKALRRDWDLLEASTQKVLAKQLVLPVLDGPSFTSSGGHFEIRYYTSGADAVSLTDLNNNAIPDWVETVATTFENVYAYYGAQGYRLAPTTAGAPYVVRLKDLAPQGFYGVTTSDQPISSANYPNAYTSWMDVDNNFTEDIYHPLTYTPIQSLQITAAHEYHHAIQYGYNIFFDVWYAEATSTWMEDELYDDVNQTYNYIPAWFSNSSKSLDLAVGSDAVSIGAGYGRWILNRYLAEQHTPNMIRGVWEKLAPLPSPGGGADIPMVPVLESLLSSSYGTSLSNDYFGFTKRVYMRDWSSHTIEIDPPSRFIPLYSPVATYSTYPVNDTVILPHYAFAYYDFTTSGVTSPTISINKTSGIQTALFKNGSEITAETSGAYLVGTFRPTDKVVLLIANTTSIDGHTASFSTNDNPSSVTEPTPAPPTTPTTPTTTSSSGGGGCFIATAAYGSYLHPQVQLLRNFRDDYLLTNAPGRALVALYYRFSPPLADFIARHPFLRGVTRLALTPFVMVIAQPAASSTALLLAVIVLYRPVRRRYLGRVPG
jgi:hypothetical protein